MFLLTEFLDDGATKELAFHARDDLVRYLEGPQSMTLSDEDHEAIERHHTADWQAQVA